MSIYTDFGFKKLFGEEENKELPLDFPRELLRNKDRKSNLKCIRFRRRRVCRLSYCRQAIHNS